MQYGLFFLEVRYASAFSGFSGPVSVASICFYMGLPRHTIGSIQAATRPSEGCQRPEGQQEDYNTNTHLPPRKENPRH